MPMSLAENEQQTPNNQDWQIEVPSYQTTTEGDSYPAIVESDQPETLRISHRHNIKGRSIGAILQGEMETG